MANVKISQIVQVKAPVKKEIKRLGGENQRTFPELLKEVVGKLNNYGFKLIHVTKSYQEDDNICSDNFWKKEITRGKVKIVLLCNLKMILNSGFKFQFDFDMWFDFSKLFHDIRSGIYERGFPYTDRPYAEDFGRQETTRILENIKRAVRSKLRGDLEGWGEHGIIDDVTDRESQDICHLERVFVSSVPEVDLLREALKSVNEGPVEILEDSQAEINNIVEDKLDELIPFSIRYDTLEAFLAYYLWFRKPGGGLEYQIYRFIQENCDGYVSMGEIEDALLRLEVHGYAEVERTPKKLRNKLEKKGIRRCKRYYEEGFRDIPGKKLFDHLKSRTNMGAYFSPLPRKRLVDHLDAPNHHVLRKIKRLVRNGYLFETKVRDYRGRTVNKIKPKRGFKNLSGLERVIMKKSKGFYDDQKKLLDFMQDSRP